MKTCLVTGAAGFIGSNLSTQLLKDGYNVIGVDSYNDYYSYKTKEQNIYNLKTHQNFTLVRHNLNSVGCGFGMWELPKKIDMVFHLAAQPGVRASWDDFRKYTDNNILATQKLLDAVKYMNIEKFIFISSSSVYGDVRKFPIDECEECKPISPYGISKLACESLCKMYYKLYRIPITILRYFTVYGINQRPDMLIHRVFKSIIEDKEIEIYGGKQLRDFVYVDDIVDATIKAVCRGRNGQIYNIGTGDNISVEGLILLIELIAKKKVKTKYVNYKEGDVKITIADNILANNILGWQPKVSLEEGLQRQYQSMI